MTLRNLMELLKVIPDEMLDYNILSEEGQTLYNVVIDHPQNQQQESIFLLFKDMCTHPDHIRTNSQGNCRDCGKPQP